MRLAFFLQPKAESAFVLCHTRAAEASGSRLWCISANAAVSFSVEDVKEKRNRGVFWQLALAILIRGRDLVLEYPEQEAGNADGCSPEDLVAELECCPCLLPLHILGNYRSLDNFSELIILFVAQGISSPRPLPQPDILERLPLRDGMLFACPDEKKVSGKLTELAGLLDINPSLEQRLDKLVSDWTKYRSLRRIPLKLQNGWMEDIARTLHMVHLDLFHDSRGQVRKDSPLTWEKDVFPAVMGSTAPILSSGDSSPILGGSMLESALSPANRDLFFLHNSDSYREKLRHVILRGVTGTGKSTLGRLLLMHEMLCDDTARVVYMGPTRMLVEESYAAFCELAEKLSRLEGVDAIPAEHIVISTGERIEQDERIRRGDFRALFVVYEKLNNFFHDTVLLRQINCVMIDEVQMICDYVRGGILDIVMTSLCREADRRFRGEDCAGSLRLIVCTTENFDLNKRLTLHPGARERERSPLMLEDKQYFRKPSTWFQFRHKKKMYSVPTYLDSQYYTNKNSIIPHPNLGFFPFRFGDKHLLMWLKEWMWGHEKVLYVSYSPVAMFPLAIALAAGRPDILTDASLLDRLHDELLRESFNTQNCEQLIMCARKGIFFNFSAMGYAARGTSAYMFRLCPYQQGVPVITFATSTIMYGVNLPADLLILKDLVWPQTNIAASPLCHSSAGGPLDKHFAYLRPCEVRNMAGRVGRQGLSNPHIVPTVLYSSFTPETPQRCHLFQKFIERMNAPQAEYSPILNRRKSPPRSLADFSPVQQRFLMNCLLHIYDRTKECSLDHVQLYIEETWAWERVRRDQETEDWRQYIASFFTFLSREFKECLYLFEKRETTWLIPLPLCYSVCQTGSDLDTLKELQELLNNWGMEAYPHKAHMVIVLLALVMTKEAWNLFLDFHREARWGREKRVGKKIAFCLTEEQKSCLEATAIQEDIIINEFRAELRAFMDDRCIDTTILYMQKFLAGKKRPVFGNNDIVGMETRKFLMTLRSALALLTWCHGERGKKITRYRNTTFANIQTIDNFLLYEDTSFKNKFVMRLAYTLSAFYVYCEESKADESLTNAVDAASRVLQQGQGL